jgi:hypothetical protein
VFWNGYIKAVYVSNSSKRRHKKTKHIPVTELDPLKGINSGVLIWTDTEITTPTRKKLYRDVMVIQISTPLFRPRPRGSWDVVACSECICSDSAGALHSSDTESADHAPVATDAQDTKNKRFKLPAFLAKNKQQTKVTNYENLWHIAVVAANKRNANCGCVRKT